MEASDYAVIGSLVGAGLIVLSAIKDAKLKADEALKLAERAHARLDRMNKASNVSVKETMAVSYREGWSPRGTWDDDFGKTQLGSQPFRESLLDRIKKWFI